MYTLHVRLYSRTGCQLCETALLQMESLRDDYEFLVEEVDIDDDPALKERLSDHIPVITVDGGNRATNPITEEKLRRIFSKALKARQAPF